MFGVYDLLQLSATRYPDKKAIVVDGKSCTYREFSARVNRVAHGMEQLEIRRGSRVSLLYRNSESFLVILYAAFKLGVCAVPMNFRAGDVELAKLLSVAETEFLFFEDELEDLVIQTLMASSERMPLLVGVCNL